ncbi:MAG: hypothetical protein JXQ93_02200 [Flavobacteriaceae bacterium]
MMYQKNPNVYEVINLYEQYCTINKFQKTIHPQNFRHWLCLVTAYIQKNRLIRSPDLRDEEKYYSLFGQKRTEASSFRGRLSSETWTSIEDPFETEFIEENIGHQANAYCQDFDGFDRGPYARTNNNPYTSWYFEECRLTDKDFYNLMTITWN